MRHVNRIAKIEAVAPHDHTRRNRSNDADRDPFVGREKACSFVLSNCLKFIGRRQLLEHQQRRGMNDQLEPDNMHWEVKERVTEQRNKRRGGDERCVEHQKISKAELEVSKE